MIYRRSFRAADVLYDMYDLYDLAHVAGWGPNNLHDLRLGSLGWSCTVQIVQMIYVVICPICRRYESVLRLQHQAPVAIKPCYRDVRRIYCDFFRSPPPLYTSTSPSLFGPQPQRPRFCEMGSSNRGVFFFYPSGPVVASPTAVQWPLYSAAGCPLRESARGGVAWHS